MRKTATGQYQRNEPVLYKGEKVGKANILELLAALKLDGLFKIEAAGLENRFAEECEKHESYESTEFLRGRVFEESTGKADSEIIEKTLGGLASKQDNNAVTIIARYHNTPRHDDDVTAMLIQSLEKLCCDLIANNYELSEQTKIKNKGYELCKHIYEASDIRNKDIELIHHWKEAWSRNNSDD